MNNEKTEETMLGAINDLVEAVRQQLEQEKEALRKARNKRKAVRRKNKKSR